MFNKEEQFKNEVDRLIADEDYITAQNLIINWIGSNVYNGYLMQQLVFLFRMNGYYSVAESFEKLLIDPFGWEEYQECGKALSNVGYAEESLHLFSRAVERNPEKYKTNFVLGCALVNAFKYEEALVFLNHAYDIEKTDEVIYLIAKVLLLLNKDQESRVWSYELFKRKAKSESKDYIRKLDEMYKRYDAVPPKNIRDWHFVEYASILVKIAGEYENDADEEIISGRFTQVDFSYQQITNTLIAIWRVINTVLVEERYEIVYFLNKKGEPIASFLSDLLGLPYKELSEDDNKEGSIILSVKASDMDSLDEESLLDSSILYISFTMNWTKNQKIVPDIIGYFAKDAKFPWTDKPESSDGAKLELQECLKTMQMGWVNHFIQLTKMRSKYLEIGRQIKRRNSYQIEF